MEILLFLPLLALAVDGKIKNNVFSVDNYYNDVTARVLHTQTSRVSRIYCGVLCVAMEGCSDVRLHGSGDDGPTSCQLLKGTSPGTAPFMYTKGDLEVCRNGLVGKPGMLAFSDLELARHHGKITQIDIFYDHVIDGIRFSYGSHKGPLRGKEAASDFTYTIKLEEDEFITFVSSYRYSSPNEAYHNCLAGLTLITNRGKYGEFGVNGSKDKIDPDSYTEVQGYRMVSAITTTKSDYLSSLEPIFNAC